jgi:sugar phosphate isomerase/epimerase
MNAFLSGGWPLSLHQLTVLDASPIDLIRIAGRLGCDHVCLFTNVPEQARHIYPAAARADVPALAETLAASGVSLYNLEVFPLDRDGEVERFEAGLQIGSDLGAKRATAHIHSANEEEAVMRFSAFADLAASYGVIAGLEFNAFSAVKDVAAAARIVRAAGMGSVVLDTLHLVRSGGSERDVAEIADLVGYCQLSDGSMKIDEDKRWREAVAERMIPGEGEFDLARLVRPLRPGTVIEVEVPQKSATASGASAEERAARAVAGARQLLQHVRA